MSLIFSAYCIIFRFNQLRNIKRFIIQIMGHYAFLVNSTRPCITGFQGQQILNTNPGNCHLSALMHGCPIKFTIQITKKKGRRGEKKGEKKNLDRQGAVYLGEKQTQVTDTVFLIYSWVFSAPQSLASPAAVELACSCNNRSTREN